MCCNVGSFALWDCSLRIGMDARWRHGSMNVEEHTESRNFYRVNPVLL